MHADQIEKLKALALAAETDISACARFTTTFDPAGVLELIAEVERLTVENINLQHAFEVVKIQSLGPAAPAAGAEKDAERLDFMIQHEAWIGWSQDGEHCRVLRRDADGDAVPMLGWGARHWRVGARDAIDAAIGASTKAGTESA